MPLDAATQNKNRDRFLFDLVPGWALGYDGNQWTILQARGDNAKNRQSWRSVSFIGSNKLVLMRILKEKGINPKPSAKKALGSFPDHFLDWRDQHTAPPPG